MNVNVNKNMNVNVNKNMNVNVNKNMNVNVDVCFYSSTCFGADKTL